MLGHRNRGMGNSSGRRPMRSQLLPNLGKMPFTNLQKAALDARAQAVASAPPFIHPELSFFNPPADAQTFRRTSIPWPLLPAPGGGPIKVLSFTVPRSKIAIINKLSVIFNGGNQVDGTGNVIWRVLLNGGGYQGLNNLTAQIGTFSNPLPVVLLGVENDTIQVTAEVPAGQPAIPGGATTAASFDGFMYPLAEATLPPRGSY
jgi:hypothetical protein